jgi:hypothetical protein
MKKVIILYLAYLGAAIIQGCCGNVECIPYVDLKAGVMRLYAGNGYQQTGTYTLAGADSLRTELDFIREFTGQSTAPPIRVIPTAMAFKCDVCANGERGLRDKIKTVLFSSNQPYNGMAAGSSLNAFFRVQKSTTSALTYFPLDSLAYYMNNSGTFITQPYKIISGTKPGNLLFHKLNMKLEFESGKVINAPSPEFSWN